MIDALPLGEIGGQHAPLDPAFGHRKDGIEHGPHTQGAGSSTAFGGWDQILDPLPLLVGQVAWICFFVHIPMLHNPRRLFRQALKPDVCPWPHRCPRKPSVPGRVPSSTPHQCHGSRGGPVGLWRTAAASLDSPIRAQALWEAWRSGRSTALVVPHFSNPSLPPTLLDIMTSDG